MTTFGTAKWHGGLKDGQGAISTKSGALRTYPYGFASRFEGKPGTNPEELIAAAHAGCFTMGLARQLNQAGYDGIELETEAAVTLVQTGGGYEISSSRLNVKGRVPGCDQKAFEQFAGQAKAGCPVSKLMKAEIGLT